MNVSVEEVKRDPEDFLHRVIEGETLVVTQDNRPVAEIRPLKAMAGPRPVGLAEGEFVVPDDFDDPLPDDLLDAFEGK
jgi:antitoxin (DNA-binding transcriptional repressor) of toxin-antitoxin stability system